MGMESVRGNIIKRVKKDQQEVAEAANLKAEAKKLVEIANAFATDEEYSYSFFMYYRALKILALLKIKEKMGDVGGLGESDALMFIAQKGLLGLDIAGLETLREIVEKILNREKIDKTEFQQMSKVVQAIKNEI